MKKKCYKIKRTDTNEFWSGYGSSFAPGGATWGTSESAAYALKVQLGYKHASIREWIPIAEIVEFEIQTNEVGSKSAKEVLLRNQLHSTLRKQYGHQFIKHYVKMQQDAVAPGKFKYAVEVNHGDFSEFRAALKGLGYSSRHYKKTDNWLWVESEDVVLNMKLIEGAARMVNLTQIETDFQNLVEDYDVTKL